VRAEFVPFVEHLRQEGERREFRALAPLCEVNRSGFPVWVTRFFLGEEAVVPPASDLSLFLFDRPISL